MYEIVTAAGSPDWSCVKKERLSQCSWSPNPAPEADFQAVYMQNGHLVFRLTSHASPTRAVNFEPDTNVWEDSCLECFLSFDGKRYMNLEVNSNSAMRAGFGTCRFDRTLLLNLGVPMPKVCAALGEAEWSVIYDISPETIVSLFGMQPGKGSVFWGNFYSCGDKTPVPHYSEWNRIYTEFPDFHRPEFFGSLVIV